MVGKFDVCRGEAGQGPSIPEKEPPWLEDFKDFAWRSLCFLDEGMVRNLKPQEALSLLQNYWDTPASFEHFKELVLSYGQKPAGVEFATLKQDDLAKDSDLYDDFMEYLLRKLPYGEQEKWRLMLRDDEKTDDEKTVNNLIDAVSRDDSGLNLGFHTSPKDFWAGEGDTLVRPEPSRDRFSDPETGREYWDEFAKTWYSINQHELYHGRTKPKWLYLVEVSRGDAKTKRHYDRGRGAFYTHGALMVRHQIPLTPETTSTFDLKFAKGL